MVSALFGWKEVLTPGHQRQELRGSPPGLGKDRQNNRAFILVRAASQSNIALPVVRTWQNQRTGCRPDKGSLCCRDVLFMQSPESKQGGLLCARPLQPCLCALWLWRREWQSGAAALPAAGDLLLHLCSDCSPSPGLLGAGTRNCNCFSNFSSFLHSVTWLLPTEPQARVRTSA